MTQFEQDILNRTHTKIAGIMDMLQGIPSQLSGAYNSVMGNNGTLSPALAGGAGALLGGGALSRMGAPGALLGAGIGGLMGYSGANAMNQNNSMQSAADNTLATGLIGSVQQEQKINEMQNQAIQQQNSILSSLLDKIGPQNLMPEQQMQDPYAQQQQDPYAQQQPQQPQGNPAGFPNGIPQGAIMNGVAKQGSVKEDYGELLRRAEAQRHEEPSTSPRMGDQVSVIDNLLKNYA